jgi:glycosyltransferase involved in cell wall biosynthesis
MLLVNNLKFGGPERQAVDLANTLDPARFDVTICSLSDDGLMNDCVRDQDQLLVVVPGRRWLSTKTARNVAQTMQRRGTQVVHAFHSETAVIASIAALRFGVPIVIHSESNANHRPRMLERAALWLTRPLCDAWIADSQSGSDWLQQQLGLPADSVSVVRRAVDTERFRPVDARATRKILGIRDDELTVGLIGHSATSENHSHLQRIAKRVVEKFPHLRFVYVGTGPEPSVATVPGNRNVDPVADIGGGESNRSVRVESAILGDRLIIADDQLDRAAVYSAMDLAVATSSHEGNRNTVLELMACETPVVISDVADHALDVRDGQHGAVLDVNDHEALAHRVLDLLGNSSRRARMGQDAREHVVRGFSRSAICKRIEAVYDAVWRRECPRPPYGDRTVAV